MDEDDPRVVHVLDLHSYGDRNDFNPKRLMMAVSESWFFGGLRKIVDTLFFWQSGHCESIYRLEVELGIQGYGDRMARRYTLK